MEILLSFGKSSSNNIRNSPQEKSPYCESKTCPECGKKISGGKFHLNKHLLSHRDRSEWPFECQLCKQKARTKNHLNRHYMSKRHQEYPRLNPQKN